MKHVEELDIQALKTVERALLSDEVTSVTGAVPKKSGKRKQKKARQEAPCRGGMHAAWWGIMLVSGGVLALLATNGYPLNAWALLLLLPGLTGLVNGTELAWHYPRADWTVWPLTMGVGMTAGGLAWLLGLGWAGLLGLTLLGLGASLLWLWRVQTRSARR